MRTIKPGTSTKGSAKKREQSAEYSEEKMQIRNKRKSNNEIL